MLRHPGLPSGQTPAQELPRTWSQAQLAPAHNPSFSGVDAPLRLSGPCSARQYDPVSGAPPPLADNAVSDCRSRLPEASVMECDGLMPMPPAPIEPRFPTRKRPIAGSLASIT